MNEGTNASSYSIQSQSRDPKILFTIAEKITFDWLWTHSVSHYYYYYTGGPTKSAL